MDRNKRQAYVTLAGAGMLLGMMAYQLWYLSMSQEQLVSFFLSLDPCIYGGEHYAERFLTSKVKSQGNLWAYIGIIMSAAMLFFRLRRPTLVSFYSPKVHVRNILLFLPIILTCLGIGIWTSSQISPAYDEVFSAVHIASHHPFQAWAYYMYPNNHVFFNLLNSTLFFWAPDQLLTAKSISILAYVGLGSLLLWVWLRVTQQQYPLALAATLACILQLPVWGFASQGRGYELYLLLEMSLLVAYGLYLQSKQEQALACMPWIVLVGYAVLPTFLFMHLAVCGLEFFASLSPNA